MKLSPEQLDRALPLAASGDFENLESLLLHFHDPLLAFITEKCAQAPHPEISPEDILQETFVAAFQNIRDFSPTTPAAFFAWLRTIAANRRINLLKARHAQKRGGNRHQLHSPTADATVTTLIKRLSGKDPTPSFIARHNETVASLTHALTRLPPDYQQILHLHYGNALTTREIAARLQKSEPAVKMLINRALKQLRTLLDSSGKKFADSA